MIKRRERRDLPFVISSLLCVEVVNMEGESKERLM